MVEKPQFVTMLQFCSLQPWGSMERCTTKPNGEWRSRNMAYLGCWNKQTWKCVCVRVRVCCAWRLSVNKQGKYPTTVNLMLTDQDGFSIRFPRPNALKFPITWQQKCVAQNEKTENLPSSLVSDHLLHPSETSDMWCSCQSFWQSILKWVTTTSIHVLANSSFTIPLLFEAI